METCAETELREATGRKRSGVNTTDTGDTFEKKILIKFIFLNPTLFLFSNTFFNINHMSDNHVMVSFDGWNKPIGYFTVTRPRKLIVFIHGFGGKAVSTWDDFRVIIKYHGAFTDCDIIFYGYESASTQATTNGSLLKQFMDVYSEPISIPGVSRISSKRYDKIIFLAHSLGAFVLRKALIHAFRDNKEWVNISKMILLAPAHNGSDIPERVVDILPGLLKVTAKVAKHFLPVLEDLQKNSSTIATLKNETKELQASQKGLFTKASVVVWAEFEKIVINDDFCDDPPPITIQGKNHLNICCPVLKDYERPVDFLLKELL